MEVESKPFWLDEKHPNYELWKRTRELVIERGKFVESLISQYKECKNLSVLDLGCGEGGTSFVFSEHNKIISCDFNKIKLSTFQLPNKVVCNILSPPFKSYKFDVIILQDVLEHLSITSGYFNELFQLLTKDGIIFISTPNKYSIINIISDPHWNAPLVSILYRNTIRKLFLRHFRKSEVNRTDIAELLSLKKLFIYTGNKFNVLLNSKFTAVELFNGKPGIIWSKVHLKILKVIKGLRLGKILLRLINDEPGMINKLVTPTYYIILTKK